jgi:hypothetical protein
MVIQSSTLDKEGRIGRETTGKKLGENSEVGSGYRADLVFIHYK